MKNKLALRLVAVLVGAGLLLLVGNAVAPPEEEWNRTFGGTDCDRGFFIQQTSNIEYIITGYTCSLMALVRLMSG